MNGFKMPFFPIPAPDETVYSVFCRCAERSGINNSNLLEHLTGQKLKQSVLSALPGYLNKLSTVLPDGHPWCDPMKIVKDHTSLQYFVYFESQDDRQFWATKFAECESSLASMLSLGIATFNNDVTSKNPRFCPACVKGDLQRLGFAYFRREHQLPGIAVCWKHEEILWHGCATCGPYPINQLAFSMTGKCFCSTGAKKLPAFTSLPDNLEALCWLARESRYLLCSTPVLTESVCIEIRTLAAKKGYGHGELIVPHKIAEAIELRFGGKFMEWLQLPIWDNGRPSIWISRALNSAEAKGRKKNTLKWLIIIGALFETVEEFEHEVVEPAFIYHDRLPVTPANPSRGRLETINHHRQVIMAGMKSHPEFSRSDLATTYPAAYAYLREHDSAWRRCNLPKKQNHSSLNRKRHVDWDAVDREMSVKLELAINDLLNDVGPPRRVSKYGLLKSIKLTCTYRPIPDLFPMVNQLLEKYVESREMFIKRKIKWAVEKIVESGKPLGYRKISRTSRLKHKNLLEFKGYIIEITKHFKVKKTYSSLLYDSIPVQENLEF